MKKSKKLLSVLLAMLMILSSLTVMASAAKANYKTVADLETNAAYSPYGAVTRLSTEERLSILFDYLDGILEAANINMGQLVSIGLIESNKVKIIVDLRSIDAICDTTIDSVAQSTGSTYWGIAKGMLGVLKPLDTSTWQKDMTRDRVSQFTIVYELLELLDKNKGIVQTVLTSGLNLGLVESFVDLGSVKSMVGDVPGLIKGKVFPLFERWDDNQTLINTYSNTAGDGGMETVLNGFVQRLFTNNMSITSYKEDAAGNCISNHTLPTVGVLDDPANGTRHYFEKGTDSTGDYILRYAYDTETGKYVSIDATTKEPIKYYKTEELDAEGKGTGEYVFVKTNEDGTEENLKYYKNDSQFLPSFAAALAAKDVTLDLSKQSPAELLYEFIPYVFAEMAPVVLNGSVKQLLAKWFGASFEEVGAVTSEAVKAVPGYDATLPIFAAEHGDYLWEWSDYAVLSNGTHVWRFEDTIYVADTSNTNPYFNIINWDYKVADNFMNEFIPGADGNTASAKGYTTLLQGLNDFLIKVANLVLDQDLVAKMNLTPGNNSNLVENIKKAAQTIVAVSPESLFGSNYEDPDRYYNLMMSNNNQEVLVGIACTVIDLLMPQMILPTADALKGKDYPVAAILAAVVREIATQLVPNINYDALIYSDYNKKTLLTGKDNSYWLDVALTIGTDIGFKYLTALADMGEDEKTVFAAANWTESKTYTASDMAAVVGEGGAVKLWEQRVDYIIDWALSSQYEWCWSFDRLVNCGAKVDLATVQDPWVKLGNIFKSILPITDVFNIDTTSETWLETLLRDDFVLALLDLDVTKIVGGATANGVLNIPTNSILRTSNTMSGVVVVIRDLLNNLLYKVAGNANLIDPAKITGIDALLTKANLGSLVSNLLNKLFVAVGTNHLLDPVIPFANFFIGWTTDAQKLADPTLMFVNPGDRAYIYSSDGATATTTLKVRNDASGMLLKHRGSTTTDHSYDLIIDSVECDDPSFTTTTTFPTADIVPGAKAEIPITLTYSGEKVVQFVITYHYIGKDGTNVGGIQKKVTYVFLSNILSDSESTHLYASEDGDKDYSGIDPFNQYVFTENVYKAITNYTQTIYYREPSNPFASKPDLGQVPKVNADNKDIAPTGIAATYFKHITEPIANYGWESKLTKEIGARSGNLYLAKTGVDENTEMPFGTYDMGVISIKYWRTKAGGSQGDPKAWDIDFIYYDDHDIGKVMNKYVGMNINTANIDSSNSSAVAAYNNYEAALKNVVQLATLPKKVATYVEICDSQMEDAINALDSAYKALSKYIHQVSSQDLLESALATAEPGGNVPEINYQDYNLYEYFEYQDERTAVRNRLNAYEAPVAPENYIAGSALSASEINALVEAETNPQKKLALNATVTEPSAKEIAAYKEAVAAWKAPAYTELDNANRGALLNYYKRFLIANTTNKQFLAKEIDAANAQGYVEADYSADSWAVYQAALATAVAVNSKENALQSEVFDAKHALMKAQNELLLKSKSVKETNALADLATLAAIAESIFANPGDYNVVGDMTEADAYAALIKALGYKYTDADGNEVVLYNRSAYEFLKYDRENTTSNLKKIDAAKQALVDAIANFKSTVEIIASEITTGGVVDTVNQYVYGVNPGDVAANYFKASNGGTLTWKVGHASSENGTGAQAIVTNKNGEPVAIYTLVIFGDVNGDGAIDAFDASLINMNMTGASALADEFAVAGDVVGENGEIGLPDYSAVVNYAIGAGSIAQTR